MNVSYFLHQINSSHLKHTLCIECTNTHQQSVWDIFWVPAAGVHAVHFMLVHMVQNLLAEQISSAVGGSAGQDVAGSLSLLYLLDGLHQSHSFAWTDRTTIRNIW